MKSKIKRDKNNKELNLVIKAIDKLAKKYNEKSKDGINFVFGFAGFNKNSKEESGCFLYGYKKNLNLLLNHLKEWNKKHKKEFVNEFYDGKVEKRK